VKITTYVANEADHDAAMAALARFDGSPDIDADVIDLYRASLDGVPAVVLSVMRIKRTGALPLTVVDDKPMVSGAIPTDDELERVGRGEVLAPEALVGRADSAIDFPTASRMHIAMFVNDIDESVKFYEVFFGQPPVKHLPDYAKFDVHEPPLVLTFNPDRKPTPGGAVNHLGIQVKSTDVVMSMQRRFAEAGFLTDEEVETPCCYAVQTKVWVGDPDGNRWEVYVVTEADADEGCGADCPCYAEIEPNRVGGEAGSSMQVSA
jgi:catechol 2,3-dioxygenase-like lactoylglutathione lyase family enzyme